MVQGFWWHHEEETFRGFLFFCIYLFYDRVKRRGTCALRVNPSVAEYFFYVSYIDNGVLRSYICAKITTSTY